MTIRSVHKRDLEQIASICSHYVTDAYTEQIREAIIERHTDDSFNCFVYEESSDVVGFMASIQYMEPVTEIEIERPEQINLPTGNGLLLKYGYVHPSYIGQGIGSQLMYELILHSIDSIQYIFAETWIKPDKPSSDALLDDIGFTEVYRSEDYYESVESQEICHGCNYPLSNCHCAGAIHLSNEPTVVLEKLQHKFD